MYFLIVILVLIIVYIVVQYNSFVQLNNIVKEAFSAMDIYLKKRWDLIPNLVEVVKGYMQHESSVLKQVVELRNMSYDKMSQVDKIDTNQQISSELLKIMAVSESYPELKASQNFSDLTSELSKIEDEIANARKYYNAVVRKLNTKVEMFPSNIVANIFNFEKSKMFEVNDSERDNAKVEL